MRRVIVVIVLAVLGGLYLYSAFAPSRRNRPVPFAISSLRKGLHAVLGVVLLLIVLFVIYGAFISTLPED
jgi:hypothetical protein